MSYYQSLKSLFITITMSFTSAFAIGQAIDYTPVYRSLNTDRSFRFSYENDFFSASDRDYTQGVYIEVIHPSLKKFPLSKLTWKSSAFRRNFGLALETNGYTPNILTNREYNTMTGPMLQRCYYGLLILH